MGKNCQPMKRRFLVIGCGSIGKRHIRNLISLGIDGVNDIIAFDLDPARREEVEKKLGIATAQTIAAAWASRPEVCLITAPTAFHLTLARQAAERNCHLFIEKPLSHNWAGVEQLMSTVTDNHSITLVGCNLRFHPGLEKIKNLLAENAIGKIIAARVEVGQYLPDWHPWEDYRQSYSARRALGGTESRRHRRRYV